MARVTLPNLRPCMVAKNKGRVERRGLFHGWNQYSTVVDASPLRGGHPGGQVSETYGIVEFPDGTVENVYPQSIRFLDHYFNDFDFGGEEE